MVTAELTMDSDCEGVSLYHVFVRPIGLQNLVVGNLFFSVVFFIFCELAGIG